MTDHLPGKHLSKPYYQIICDFKEHLLYIRRLASTTTWGYVSFMADFCEFLNTKFTTFGIKPEEVTREDILEFIKYKKSKGMQDSSLSSYIGALRQFYNWLSDRNKSENLKDIAFFLTKVVRMTRGQTATEVPSIKEVHRLRSAIHAHKQAASFNKESKKYTIALRDAAIMEMLIAIGSRSNEIRSVCLKDLNLEDKTVLIRKGKGSRQRHSIFSDLAKETILEHITHNEFEPEDLIFEVNGSMLNKLIKKWAYRAQINERIHPHSFRHYHVTESQRNGIPAQLVADQVGHVNLNTTRRYTHLDVEFRRSQYEKNTL